jgi:imidazolonepropionase-like amidohydrolase
MMSARASAKDRGVSFGDPPQVTSPGPPRLQHFGPQSGDTRLPYVERIAGRETSQMNVGSCEGGTPMRRFATLCFILSLTTPAIAQVPITELAKPAPEARHFVILSTAAKHGDSWAWTAADGSRRSRESLLLRGQVWEIDANGKAGPDGLPASVTIRGVTPRGDAAETFVIADGKARWKSPADTGEIAYPPGRFYYALTGLVEPNAWLIERLLATPDRMLDLLPGGQARAEKLTSLDVGDGAKRQTVTAWVVTGLNNIPMPIWTDAEDKFFAVRFGLLGALPVGYESTLPAIEKAQNAALAARVAAISRQIGRAPKGAVAFTNVQIYDADTRRFLSDQTVVVGEGRITAVGPVSAVAVPADSERIDGRGKTLVPGLWDCHMHTRNDYTGLQELSLGVTSVRDPGNSDAATLDRRARREKGELLSPHVYPSSLIDGQGPYTAQAGNVATSQDQAIALVRQAKVNGFTGVKFYGTFDARWLPATVAEAKKQGLHVHGHIPVGLRPMEAIKAGYDEITHINWIIMQALPESVIKISNGMARFEGPGRYAKEVDITGEALRTMLSTMASKRITSDPTMVAFEGLYVPQQGELAPAYAPFLGTLPPILEREFRRGGFAVPKDLTRADYRASWAKLVELLAAMHKAGVPIVAGTDGSGVEIIRELEIYTQAGLTPAEALAAATISPARLVGADKTTGSIAAGKAADLVLVEGDPSKRIGDLRNTRLVMMDGMLMDADALRAAAGFSGRPKTAR